MVHGCHFARLFTLLMVAIMANLYTPQQANSSDAEMAHYTFDRLLRAKHFIEPVVVESVTAVSDVQYVVSVMPLVKDTDPEGNPIDNSIVYGIPYLLWQGGGNAVIIPPVVGDIGLIAVADKDITQVKNSKSPSAAQTNRTHSRTDSVYMGSILSGEPTQWIKFLTSGIDIKASGPLTVTTSGDLTIKAASVNINGLNIGESGTLTLADGSVVDKHTHGGVEYGLSNTSPLGG